MGPYAGCRWTPVPGVTVLEGHDASGWGWNVIALTRASGGLVLYSPSWLGPDSFDRIDALGSVEVLLVPSHFHHLTLERFRERYPKARTVAPRRALPRLAAQGHLGLGALEEEPGALPEGARWLDCEGLKTGEGWLFLETSAGRALVVCDTWMNRVRPLRGLKGFFTGKVVPEGLSVPATLRWLHASDLPRYARWARTTLVVERPRILIPSHGEPSSSPDLCERLLAMCLLHGN